MIKSDEELIADYLNGDDPSFEKLVKRHINPLYNFLHQLTGDVAQAEDLTQEAFVRAWKNIRKFDQTKSFKTWLFAIAKNAAFDYLKKKKSIPFSYFENPEGNNNLEEISDESILMDEIIARKDLVEKLEIKLKQIPETFAIILKLRYKEDFTLGEISEILGKPYNTIKVYHRRALERLKKAFLEN